MRRTAKRPLTRSEAWWNRAVPLIPAGSQTFSKGPTQFIRGVAPKYLRRGKGCRVWDVDGNEYIDWTMGLLPVILGYAHPSTTRAIRRQLRDGISFTLMHPLEVEVSEIVSRLIPCAEMVRFGKNGSDVTAAAVRVARAYTGREKVACCGYHGWQDWFIGSTTRNRGVPKAVKDLVFAFEYNNIASLEAIFAQNAGQIAAVIMEPVIFTPPKDGFLRKVADLARRNGALFILDEIVTGFRFSLGGAQEYFGVTPDLATFGKGIANGMPLSVLAGKREIMRLFEEVFFSFTFGGETLSLAAAKATLAELEARKVIPFLWKQGEKIQKGFQALIREERLEGVVECAGYPVWTGVNFAPPEGGDPLAAKSLFQQECIKRGVLFSAKHNVSFSHRDGEIRRTLEVYQEALRILKSALSTGSVEKRLEGKKVEPVFRTVG